MAANDDEVLYHRRFLNDSHGAAMVEVQLNDYSHTDKEGKRHPSFSGSIHITDCNRSVGLDVDYGDLEDAQAVVRKLNRLIDSVEQVRDAVKRTIKKEWKK